MNTYGTVIEIKVVKKALRLPSEVEIEFSSGKSICVSDNALCNIIKVLNEEGYYNQAIELWAHIFNITEEKAIKAIECLDF